jgi:predicted DNA-binding protein with PD1-like motif
VHVIEVRNAELMESITKQAAERGITYAAIVALIGAIDSFTVSTNPAGDATAHTYSSYALPAEMTATGEIVDGKPHIHAVMAVKETGPSAATCTRRRSTPLSRAPM